MKSNKGNIFFLISIIYILLVLSPLVLVLSGTIPEITEHMGIYYIVTSALMLLIPIGIYFFITREPIKVVLSIKKISMKNVIIIVGFSIFIQPILGVISYLSTYFSDNVAEETIGSLLDTNFFVGFIAIALIPALLEELFMRGIIQWNYGRVGPRYIFLINGLLFGILHQNFQQFFYAFFIGFFLSLFVYYTGSIFASIIGHFVINGSQFVLGYLSVKSGAYEIGATQEMTLSDNISFAIMVLIAGCICMMIFKAFYRENIENKVDNDREYENPFNITLLITLVVGFGFLLMTL